MGVTTRFLQNENSDVGDFIPEDFFLSDFRNSAENADRCSFPLYGEESDSFFCSPKSHFTCSVQTWEVFCDFQ